MKGRAGESRPREARAREAFKGLSRTRYARRELAHALSVPLVALLSSLVLSCGDDGAPGARNVAPTGSPDDGVAARATTRLSTDVDSAVRAVARGFSDALAAGDSTAALALLDPSVLIFEAGHAENYQQYREGHLAADMEFTASVHRNILDEQVVTTHDMAMYTSQYTAVGPFRGRSVHTRGAETIVLIPTKDGWKIRHIHWSSR